MDMHYATVWETVADTVPDAVALVHADTRLSWAEVDDRAARLATALAERGVGPDGKVALYLYNGPEYVIAQYAVFKLRAVAVNVNYRYLRDELAYVLDNSGSQVVVYHSSLAGPLAAALHPPRPHLVAVDDGGAVVEGSAMFDDLVTAPAPMARIERSGDDIYMLYTGGTTGRPKGVMYRHADHCGYINPLGYQYLGLDPPTTVAEVPDAVRRAHARGPLRSVVAPPLMHGTGNWLGVFTSWGTGGAAITLPSRSFDADGIWRAVERHRATGVTIVGDAFARPLLRSLDAARGAGRPFDLSSLRVMVSSGAMWSAEVQRGLLAHADLLLVDSMGSTEAGMGVRRTSRSMAPATGWFEPRPGVRVIDEDGRDVVPGSGRAGMIASPARAIGYFKDPARTAATFTMIDGRRYVRPGDWATVEPDGSMRLLGRGSQCINTGGEKVYPEEVEEAMSRHPDVEDSIVLGVPDERFGEQVVAVISTSGTGGTGGTDGAAVAEWLRGRLAGYKVPKRVVVVDRVQRLANGKADYPWARAVVLEAGSPPHGRD
jgi:acyl-CoA synthetase (AMP-forming)/AMP-acid ligase II